MSNTPKLRFYMNRNEVPQHEISLVSARDVRTLIEYIRDNDLDSLTDLIDDLQRHEIFGELEDE
jgi:hypothetical protein